MPDPFDFYLSSPVIDAQTVYVGSGDGNIYALDAASGALRWKFRTGNVVHASPAIANGMVYIGSWDSYFYAIDARSGHERWRFKTGEDHEIVNQVGIQSSAIIAEDMVYFGCRDSNLYALDAVSGVKSGHIPPKALGSFRPPLQRTECCISPPRIQGCCTQSMPRPACSSIR
jgi:outer membrane protein assembly factor BamB